jgi:hypothetical protein
VNEPGVQAVLEVIRASHPLRPVSYIVRGEQLGHFGDVAQVASGPMVACLRTCFGAVVCTDEAGEFSRQITSCGARDIEVAGVRDVCYVDDTFGRVVCDEEPFATLAKSLAGVTQVAIGMDYLCGLKPDGTVVCVGENDRGQLGDGTQERRAQAVQVDLPVPASSIAAGSAHTCVHTGDAFYCWGANNEGQLGVGDYRDRSTPTRVLLQGSTTSPDFDERLREARATREH